MSRSFSSVVRLSYPSSSSIDVHRLLPCNRLVGQARRESVRKELCCGGSQDCWRRSLSHFSRDKIQQDPRLPGTVKDAYTHPRLGTSVALPVVVDSTLRSLLG